MFMPNYLRYTSMGSMFKFHFHGSSVIVLNTFYFIKVQHNSKFPLIWKYILTLLILICLIKIKVVKYQNSGRLKSFFLFYFLMDITLTFNRSFLATWRSSYIYKKVEVASDPQISLKETHVP